MEHLSVLPPELSYGAILRDREYAWNVESFPAALKVAPTLGYACLGGQFQLRPNPDAIYELFWVEANSSERLIGESWDAYTERSCCEVSEQFVSLLKIVDFREEALKFKSLDSLLVSGMDLVRPPLFNAYFVTEQEWLDLRPHA